jgi:Tfp pilus assembly protein PilZ
MTDGPPLGLNRRRSERIPMPPSGGTIAVVGARLVNVSAYGMMIESPMPLNVDALMPFRLVVAGHKADVEARVAACTPHDDGGRRRYGVGLEFIGISEDLRERIRQTLHAHLGIAPASA